MIFYKRKRVINVENFILSEKVMNDVFVFIKDLLFLEKTGLIYDHIIKDREEEFPTAAEIASAFPNPCGYATGMEDGMINGGTMLDACLIKYKNENDNSAAEFARKLFNGMLNCAFKAKSEGFLPRGVSPEDGCSHYFDSSRDQYTMFAFAMHRYLNSDLCSPEDRERIKNAAVSIARRAERNVTEKTKYDMLTADGKTTLVTKLWGDDLSNHEYFRLPMLYLLVFESSGDEYWFNKYIALRDKAFEKSLPMQKEYWALYSLQQMQCSILLCHDVEIDVKWKEKYILLMNKVADYTEDITDYIYEKIEKYNNYNAPQPSFRNLKLNVSECFLDLGYEKAFKPHREDENEFFILQDGAQAAIIAGLVPKRMPKKKTQELLFKAFNKIDLSKHERNLPLYFFDGYYRCKKQE